MLWEEFDEAATCHSYRTGCSRHKKIFVLTCGLVSITQEEEISKRLSRAEDLFWKWKSTESRKSLWKNQLITVICIHIYTLQDFVGRLKEIRKGIFCSIKISWVSKKKFLLLLNTNRSFKNPFLWLGKVVGPGAWPYCSITGAGPDVLPAASHTGLDEAYGLCLPWSSLHLPPSRQEVQHQGGCRSLC